MAWFAQGIRLALGGGGARGFAHLGVLELLLERGVRLRGAVGVSAGALAGAGLALGREPAEVRELVRRFARSHLARDRRVRALVERGRGEGCLGLGERLDRLYYQGRMLRSLLAHESVLPPDYLRQVVEFFLPDVRLEDAAFPFAVVATDLATGEPVYLDRGPLRAAVLASCAVPGMTPPVEIGGRRLVDGGVVSLLPTREARRQGGGPVLAVALHHDLARPPAAAPALEAYLRASDLMSLRLTHLQMEAADLVIRPEVGGLHWADFAQADLALERGRQAAEAAWPAIARLLRPWRRGLRGGHGHGLV